MHSGLRHRWAAALHRPSLWSPTVWVEPCNVTKSCCFSLRQPCMKMITPICTAAPEVACIYIYIYIFFCLQCWKACKPLHTALRCGGIFAIQVMRNVWIGLQKHLHLELLLLLNVQVGQDACSPLFNIGFSTRACQHADKAWQGCEINVFVSLVAEVGLFHQKPVGVTWPVSKIPGSSLLLSVSFVLRSWDCRTGLYLGSFHQPESSGVQFLNLQADNLDKQMARLCV